MWMTARLSLLFLLPISCRSSSIPFIHFWPQTVESQDISGPIGIHNSSSNGTTWHVFIDCVEGANISIGALSWCHFVSYDLVEWTELPIAMRPDEPYDIAGLDTGSVFQHPNGTVYAVYEARCNRGGGRHVFCPCRRSIAHRVAETLWWLFRHCKRWPHCQSNLHILSGALSFSMSSPWYRALAVSRYQSSHGLSRPRCSMASPMQWGIPLSDSTT